MAKEEKKDFNAMLNDSKGMPKFQTITDQKSIEKYGGSRMYFAPPIDYDKIMKQIPYGTVTTVGDIRQYFAACSGADFTEPITAGIFVSIAAWASHQRSRDKTPYWRTLKANGELNPKYPGGIEAQRAKLEAEGHSILQKGRKNLRYFVKDYEASLFGFPEIRYLAEEDSLTELSNVYQQSWNHAYRNIMPQSYLDSIPSGHWADNVRQEGIHTLIMRQGNSIIGTASFCQSRWEKYPGYGEIISIYFLPEYMGKGYGKQLIGKAVDELRRKGFTELLLWVLEENQAARKFYEACGFSYCGERKREDIGGESLTELMYQFP